MAGFELVSFESSGKHTNHYTTKATLSNLSCQFFLERTLADERDIPLMKSS
jgi:hypothetical protein